ncbi:hypothetical protein M4D51_07830 [Microbacterium sp. p3-SID338]|uniref:hypothetical protein n=1 Tax=Microbacterium sp. p3-SID338 TaxID=2916214 RepID=UPI0021A2D86E|nr:hypothetical protein [Microbacterium sp. p3-SID338]MCT1395634.1 hypothetical protein [Microbacterium sp. p3-SID338]
MLTDIITTDVAAVPEADVFADAKQVAEHRQEFDPHQFDGAFFETVCPSCEHTVGALVIDGPDPVFVDVQCPRTGCGHEWTEQIA